MKKVLFVLLIVCLFGFHTVHAQTTPKPVLEQLNARILPSIWYSTVSITEGDSLQIFAAVQNNSGIDFEGKAKFLIDGEIVSETAFTSVDNSLKDVSTEWVATTPGSHTVVVKLVATIPTDKTLIAYETDKSTISIKKSPVPIAKEKSVPEEESTPTDDTALKSGIGGVIDQIDTYANTSAEKLESFKKIPTTTPEVRTTVTKGDKVSITPVGAPRTTTNKTDSIWNSAIDILANLLRNWGWTLGIMFALFLIFKISRSRKE